MLDKTNENSEKAKQKQPKTKVDGDVVVKEKEQKDENNSIILKPLETIMHESMMPYSEFVIMDRALPRVEDGLKPVQRRVLYSMLEVGVTPDKPYRKSARIVGDCMGKYHPHGDKSIYDTMVRMAQDFNMREILVDGHGNYGSVDGDGAAAMRYTEARLSPISLELLRDIEKETVSWSFNFDDTTKEPDMLPGRFPNLLVNGSTGIAVGLATNIPTHNLGEVIDAVIAYIDNRSITLAEVMKLMPAPDFSTGGYLIDNADIKQMYETGRGKLIMRAKLHVEDDDDKKAIVITEIPFQINKANMLQKIAKLKESDTSGVYASIVEIVDESDRNGTRAVIKLKKDANPDQVIKLLYKNSDLQTNFNANIVAIADGKPKQLSLLEIIAYYVEYQKGIIFKRTKYDLDISEKREHILNGLLIAIKNIDDVIRIIKNSQSTSEAKQTLMQTFYLTDVQAQAILDLRLARLTNLEVNKLINELEELRALIEKLKKILASNKMQYNLVKTELKEIKQKYATARKTEIIVDDSLDEINYIEEQIITENVEEVRLIYTADDTIKTVTEKSYNQSSKELTDTSELHEVPQINIKIMNNKYVYIFTNLGNCHKVRVTEIPIIKFKDKGVILSSIIKGFELSEKVVNILELDEYENDLLLCFTKQGYVKLTNVSEYYATKQKVAAIKLKDNDELIGVEVNDNDKLITMFTREGNSLTYNKTDIPVNGRLSMGVKGVNLNDNDVVVSAFQTSTNNAFTVFLSNGNAKVIKFKEVPLLARTRKGGRVLNLKDRGNNLVRAFVLDKNVSYVAHDNFNRLSYVLNKKMALGDKDDLGKYVLKAKGKSVKVNEVYPFMINS